MLTTLLLIAAVALACFSRPKDRQSYQMAVLSIIGIAYFSIWRFADFYIYIFNLDSNIKNISFIILLSIALGLCFLPVVRSISRVPAIILSVLFLICVVITFSFEKNIKNRVAGWGGYFSDTININSRISHQIDTQVYQYNDGGISIHTPLSWQKKKHSSGLNYFEFIKNNEKYAELRPRCFHNVKTSIAEIIMNMENIDKQQGFRDEKQCTFSKDNLYRCLLKSTATKNTEIKQQWRWLVMDNNQNQNTELDFIFYKLDAQTEKDANIIIDSLIFNRLDQPLPACISPVEWF